MGTSPTRSAERVVLERMLAGVSMLRHRRTQDRVGDQVEANARSMSKSSVYRTFEEQTKRALQALMSRSLADMWRGAMASAHHRIVMVGCGYGQGSYDAHDRRRRPEVGQDPRRTHWRLRQRRDRGLPPPRPQARRSRRAVGQRDDARNQGHGARRRGATRDQASPTSIKCAPSLTSTS